MAKGVRQTLKTLHAAAASPVRPNNAVGQLRRIRNEVALLMQRLDDALSNLDTDETVSP